MFTEEPADTWFCEVLTYAACAGSCRAMARLAPEASRGLNKVADHRSEQAWTLMLGGMRAASPSGGFE